MRLSHSDAEWIVGVLPCCQSPDVASSYGQRGSAFWYWQSYFFASTLLKRKAVGIYANSLANYNQYLLSTQSDILLLVPAQRLIKVFGDKIRPQSIYYVKICVH